MDKNKKSFVESLVIWIAYAVLAMTSFIAVVAVFSNDVAGEASVGSFKSATFNQNWIVPYGDELYCIDLPFTIDVKSGDLITIKNTLPENISDNSSLMTRASMEDIYVYVDGELREEYSTDSQPYMSYYIPSAYVVVTLNSEDSGKEIEIKLRAKDEGFINEMRIGPGNNVWFDIIFDNLPVNMVGLMVLILGLVLLCFSKIFKNSIINYYATFYLSLLMIDISVWVFSESAFRQIIFSKASMSQYFSYSSMELIGVLACMYFDEVQHREYHTLYFIAELTGISIILLNFTLHFTGVVELYKSMPLAHIGMCLSLIMAVTTIVFDLKNKRIKKYKAVAFGMGGLLIAAGIEIALFYITRFRVFGIYICIGMVFLMATTVVQSLIDQSDANILRETKQRNNMVNTIETIAGTIDAKDEYTGGHSERVGLYAAILARGMAAHYNFSEEDIERIRYIGNMHDIGKIGIPDRVLNKAGRLDEDEFNIMKKHVEIGSDIMSGLDDNIKELHDGIRYHHERFDGKGYPDGLAETEIPLVARIICLADCYDAMTSDRVYRKHLSPEAVRAEIVRCSGTQFDPALSSIFLELIDSGEMRPN